VLAYTLRSFALRVCQNSWNSGSTYSQSWCQPVSILPSFLLAVYNQKIPGMFPQWYLSAVLFHPQTFSITRPKCRFSKMANVQPPTPTTAAAPPRASSPQSLISNHRVTTSLTSSVDILPSPRSNLHPTVDLLAPGGGAGEVGCLVSGCLRPGGEDLGVHMP
jgi:hypothetical protein